MKLLGVTHVFGSIGYAAGLAVTEKSHDFINNRIRSFANTEKRDWCRYLPFIAYSFNASVSAGTQMSPFMTLFGFETLLPSEMAFGPHRYDFLNEVNNRFEVARDIAQQNLLVAQDRAVKSLNHKRRDLTFQVGDLALVRRVTRKKNVSHKMLSVFEGPVKILEVGKVPVIYLVQYLGSKRKKWYTHVSKLKAYILRDITKLGLPTNSQPVPIQDSDAASSDAESENLDDQVPTVISSQTTPVPHDKPRTSSNSNENSMPHISVEMKTFPQLDRRKNHEAMISVPNLRRSFPQTVPHASSSPAHIFDDMPALTPYNNQEYLTPTQLSPQWTSPPDTANLEPRVIPAPENINGDHHDVVSSPHLPIGSPPPTHGYFLRQRK